MDTPVEQKNQLNAACVETCCEKKEACFCLYAKQIWSGPDPSDVLTVDPVDRSNRFGQIRSDDWPLLDGTGADAKVVGRVYGEHILSNTKHWMLVFNIIFQDDRYYNGSSLAVRGETSDSNNVFEWAILGGTGELTLAEGIVYGKVVSSDANGEVRKLCFHVFYRPIKKPDM